MTDSPNTGPPPTTRVLEPTSMAERQSFLIVLACIVALGAVIAFLGFRAWPGADVNQVVKYLAWLGLGALIGQVVALLVQLSSKVGSKVRTSIGPTGLSVDIEGSGDTGAQ
jgi:ABC-type transporter Mla maintaining outer membrane lipid asymmetry permease subunit MlaE